MRSEAAVADCTSGRYVGTESARETDRHKTSGCCSGSSEMLREKSTAAGVRNSSGRAVQRHFLRSGCGCMVCTAERACLLRGTSCSFKYNSCNFLLFLSRLTHSRFFLQSYFRHFWSGTAPFSFKCFLRSSCGLRTTTKAVHAPCLTNFSIQSSYL